MSEVPGRSPSVLGKRGENLAKLAAPLATKKKPPKIDGDAKAFLPWLDANAGPELKAWNALLRTRSVRSVSGKFSVARGYTFTHAVRGVSDDGCWLARVRSLFLAMSPIFEAAEELYLATWFSSPIGENVVWYSHQDEWEFQSPSPSIAAFLARRLVDEAEYSEGEDDAVVVSKEVANAAAKEESRKVKISPHLDAGRMQARTDWIVALFLAVSSGDDGLARAPTLKVWKREKALAKEWPHLQAYWLLHHLVFDNRDELADLVKMHERRYPAAKELAGWARSVLAGKPITSKAWNEKRVRGVRVRAAEARLDFFTVGAKARLAESTSGMRAASAKADAVLAASSAAPPKLWELSRELAGKIAELEDALNRQWTEDDDQMKVMMWNRRGNGTLVHHLLWDMTEKVDPSLREFFAANVNEGRAFDETHEKNVLGSLACWATAIGNWEDAVKEVEKILGPIEKQTRLRRLELAVAAERLIDAPKNTGALAFLRVEAKRFVDQISEWQTDTALTAFPFLLRRNDPEGVALFNRTFEEASFSGANWTLLLTLVNLAFKELKNLACAPGLVAAVTKKLGRPDDGDRPLVVRAYASLAGKKGVVAIERWIAANTEVRKDCENGALVAGLIEAGGAAYADRAHGALAELLLKPDSMRFGTAIGLLRAVHEKRVSGFGAAAANVLAAAKKDKHAKKPLVAWLADATFE
ncbi:MAG: hypothetical protein ABI551_15475 [Polyangiaceae bacterium]